MLLSMQRDRAAAKRFFRHALKEVRHIPEKVTTDGHDSYLAHVVEISARTRDNMPMNEARAYNLSSTLAPWAEVVLGVGPATVEDLLTRPDDSWRYEVVEGVLVRVAGSPFDATTIALILAAALLA